MGDLKKLREKIDKIDKAILSLIEKRIKTATKIAKIKRKLKIPIYQPKREKELIKKIGALAKKKRINQKFVKSLFRKIIRYTRKNE